MIIIQKKNIYDINKEYYYKDILYPTLMNDEHYKYYNLIKSIVNESNNFPIKYNIESDINNYIYNVRKDLLENTLFEYLARNKLSEYKSFKIFVNEELYEESIKYYKYKIYDFSINMIKKYISNLQNMPVGCICTIFMHYLFITPLSYKFDFLKLFIYIMLKIIQ